MDEENKKKIGGNCKKPDKEKPSVKIIPQIKNITSKKKEGVNMTENEGYQPKNDKPFNLKPRPPQGGCGVTDPKVQQDNEIHEAVNETIPNYLKKIINALEDVKDDSCDYVRFYINYEKNGEKWATKRTNNPAEIILFYKELLDEREKGEDITNIQIKEDKINSKDLTVSDLMNKDGFEIEYFDNSDKLFSLCECLLKELSNTNKTPPCDKKY